MRQHPTGPAAFCSPLRIRADLHKWAHAAPRFLAARATATFRRRASVTASDMDGTRPTPISGRGRYADQSMPRSAARRLRSLSLPSRASRHPSPGKKAPDLSGHTRPLATSAARSGSRREGSRDVPPLSAGTDGLNRVEGDSEVTSQLTHLAVPEAACPDLPNLLLIQPSERVITAASPACTTSLHAVHRVVNLRAELEVVWTYARREVALVPNYLACWYRAVVNGIGDAVRVHHGLGRIADGDRGVPLREVASLAIRPAPGRQLVEGIGEPPP
jgi:hypothetical protein